MSENLSRRSFVTRSTGAALATGPAVLRSLGANNKVNIGFIGAGSRGYYLMEMLYKGSPDAFQITAVCDTFTDRLARAKDRVESMGKNVPKTYDDFHKLLADPSVEAVVIATPEHLHQAMTLAAIKAKKHIYVEKPLAHTIEEGEVVLKAAANYDRVIQVGTQNRSNKFYQKAKALVAEGLIGDVHYVRAFWYRNSLDTNPAWRYQIPADANPTEHRLGAVSRQCAPAPVQQGTLLPVAPLLGLFGRHFDRPAGAPDRHHQLRLRQDRARVLHGFRRRVSLGQRDRRPRSTRHHQRHLRVPRQVPHQL